MQWLSLIIALLKAISLLSEYLKQRQLIDAATADLFKKQMEASNELISNAKKARADASAVFNASNGVPDHKDPNLRD